MNVDAARDVCTSQRQILRNLAGIVCSYDQQRHRWFVKPDEKRLGDILLTSEVLHRFGRSRLSEGVAVSGVVLTSDPAGLQFVEITTIGEDEPPIPARLNISEIEPTGGPTDLVVKWFHATKGYGFFLNSVAGGPDIFLHKSVVEAAGLKTDFGEGAKFRVTWGEKPGKGLLALTIAVPE